VVTAVTKLSDKARDILNLNGKCNAGYLETLIEFLSVVIQWRAGLSTLAGLYW
jgi:hypothetical protein